MHFHEKTVLITGGCSGIGKIMARKSLERGASRVIIIDVNDAAFQGLKDEWKALSGEVITFQADLSDVNQIRNVATKIKETYGIPNVLINNAGIVTGKYFHEHSHENIALSMAVNADAMMHLTLEFLPGMIERNSGSIGNICSLAGLIGNTKMAVYVASKWAAVGWSDCLRLEMQQLDKNVKVTTIMPYYINTGMFDGVRSGLIPILKPEPSAEKFMRAIEKEKRLLATPVPYWFIRLSQGLLPLPAFDFVMKNIFGVYDTMKEFKGRIEK